MSLFLAGFRQQDNEFVPAVAGDYIAVPHRRPQGVGNLLEKEVAKDMAVLVVDGLEIVQINYQQGKGVLVPVGPPGFVADQLPEHPLIVEMGQRVPGGVVFQIPGVFVNGLYRAHQVDEGGENAVQDDMVDGIHRQVGLDPDADNAAHFGGLKKQRFGAQFEIFLGEFFWQRDIRAAVVVDDSD